eukprot:UN06614
MPKNQRAIFFFSSKYTKILFIDFGLCQLLLDNLKSDNLVKEVRKLKSKIEFGNLKKNELLGLVEPVLKLETFIWK